MIEARGLSKRYASLHAVSDVSFSVGRGEIVGLLGPNGAGKTTTMRMLTGALPPTEGSATVAGLNVAEHPMAVRKAIGYLPERPPLYPDLTVREYLHFVATLKGLRGAAREKEINRVIDVAGVGDVRDRLSRNLSKGFGQRTGLAQALLGDPKVLILDEPTAGLDPRQIGEVRILIAQLAREHTVILSTHILQEVVATCERVLILSRGRIVADDQLDQLVERHGGSRAAGDTPSLERIFLEMTED